MLIDLHVHTRYSACSRLSLAQILEHAAGRGLDGVCITDHHSVQALEQITPGLQSNGLRLFVGQEYSTAHGDFLIFGPLAAYPQGMTAHELLNAVAQAGGAAVAAHPFRPQRPTAESIVREKRCRIVESVNGRNSAEDNQKLSRWRRKYEFIECAGSDAHSLEELGTVGTRFLVPIDSTTDLVQALNDGLCRPQE